MDCTRIGRQFPASRRGAFERLGTDYQKDRPTTDYPISAKAEAQALGLHKPTAFGIDGQSTKHLIWCAEFFVPPNYIRNQGLFIGRLSEAQRQAVSELLAKTP